MSFSNEVKVLSRIKVTDSAIIPKNIITTPIAPPCLIRSPMVGLSIKSERTWPLLGSMANGINFSDTCSPVKVYFLKLLAGCLVKMVRSYDPGAKYK